MSQIFDALQRSEAERAGNPLETPLEPNDMLRRAERQIATKWESQSVLDGADSVAVEEINGDRPQPIFNAPPLGSSAAGAINSSKNDDRLRILELGLSVPRHIDADLMAESGQCARQRTYHIGQAARLRIWDTLGCGESDMHCGEAS